MSATGQGVGLTDEPTRDGAAAEELERVLTGGLVSMELQPIVSLRTGRIKGYEALARGPHGSPLREPTELFAAAGGAGKRSELESLCQRRALEAKRRHLKPGETLFVNVDPRALPLTGPDCLTCRRVAELGLDPGEITFELTERMCVVGDEAVLEVVARYRRHGYGIALDDVGMGFSGLAAIVALRPDYVKLDGYLVRDVGSDRYRRNLIKGLVNYCLEMGMGLVAECIETVDELAALCELGVPYGQGYFLAPPGAGRPGLRREAAELLVRLRA